MKLKAPLHGAFCISHCEKNKTENKTVSIPKERLKQILGKKQKEN